MNKGRPSTVITTTAALTGSGSWTSDSDYNEYNTLMFMGLADTSYTVTVQFRFGS